MNMRKYTIEQLKEKSDKFNELYYRRLENERHLKELVRRDKEIQTEIDRDRIRQAIGNKDGQK